MAAFARRAIEVAIEDHVAASAEPGWTVFDRGLVDGAAALQHATGESLQEELIAANRYHERVFLTPPWPESMAPIQSADHQNVYFPRAMALG